MKRIVLVFSVLIVASLFSFGQTSSTIIVKSSINSERIEVSFQKTTHLIFPTAIKNIDRGSDDILVQKAGGVENVLKVKAAKQGFDETNLTVITSDGQLFSFIVNYNATPGSLNIQLKLGSKVTTPAAQATKELQPPAMFTEKNGGNQRLKEYAAKGSITRRNIKNIFSSSGRVNLQLVGIYTADDVLYYKLVVSNSSAIGYEVDAIRFLIQEKKRLKRTSSQQLPIEPLYMVGHLNTISNKEDRLIMIALPKHTVGRTQELIIEMDERSGSRHLTLVVKEKQILKVRKLDL